jgi:1-acyl-sn-glycerol-3-phosphate acyltransferase
MPRYTTPRVVAWWYGARSLVFIPSVWLFMVVLGLWIPVFRHMEVKARWYGARCWVRSIFASLRALCGLSHEVRGREQLPQGAFILACKHQSAWETLVFTDLLERPAYVLKRELMRIPLFGAYLRLLEMIPINRSKGSDALSTMLQAAQKAVREGRPIVIFPEGTRTAPGVPVKYRKRGIMALYETLGVPIVPVALNSGLYWGRKQITKYPGVITLEILPPIPPGLPPEEMIRRLHEDIETASDRLAREALGV